MNSLLYIFDDFLKTHFVYCSRRLAGADDIGFARWTRRVEAVERKKKKKKRQYAAAAVVLVVVVHTTTEEAVVTLSIRSLSREDCRTEKKGKKINIIEKKKFGFFQNLIQPSVAESVRKWRGVRERSGP